MKILCKEAFIIIHHGYFCRVSFYRTLGWHNPRDAAVYHLFWNEQILLRYLSQRWPPFLIYSNCTSTEFCNVIVVDFHQQESASPAHSQSLALSRESESLGSIFLRDAEKYNKIIKPPFQHWSSGDTISFQWRLETRIRFISRTTFRLATTCIWEGDLLTQVSFLLYQFGSPLFTVVYRFKYLFYWWVVVVLEW